jgi:hypothetical protein
MTPELAAMIRTEIARLADQINELTAQRTALVKVLANGAEVPTVEAPEPPTFAFAATPSPRSGRRKAGDPTPTVREILRKIVADAGRAGIERQDVLATAGRKTNATPGSVNTMLSRMKTEGVFSEDDAGVFKLNV